MFGVQGYYAKRLWVVSCSCMPTSRSGMLRPELKNMPSLRVLRLLQLEGRRRWLLYFYCLALPIGLMAGIRSVLGVRLLSDGLTDLAIHTFFDVVASSLTYWASTAPQFSSWREINQEDVNIFEKLSRPFRECCFRNSVSTYTRHLNFFSLHLTRHSGLRRPHVH